jgi:hypothetical protein
MNTEDYNNNSDTQKQTEAGAEQPKTFTQDEVNAIVSERLSREKAKLNNQFAEREAEITARENRLECKEFLKLSGYPEKLIDIYNTEDAESFKNNVDKLMKTFPEITTASQLQKPTLDGFHPAQSGQGSPSMREDEEGKILKAFGI